MTGWSSGQLPFIFCLLTLCSYNFFTTPHILPILPNYRWSDRTGPFPPCMCHSMMIFACDVVGVHMTSFIMSFVTLRAQQSIHEWVHLSQLWWHSQEWMPFLRYPFIYRRMNIANKKNCEVFMITDKDKWRLANRRTFRKFPVQKISISIKLKGNNQDIDVILYDIDTLLLLRKLINKFR